MLGTARYFFLTNALAAFREAADVRQALRQNREQLQSLNEAFAELASATAHLKSAVCQAAGDRAAFDEHEAVLKGLVPKIWASIGTKRRLIDAEYEAHDLGVLHGIRIKDAPRQDRLRSAVLSHAIAQAREYLPGNTDGEFTASALAYFAIAEGLDAPTDRVTESEMVGASLVFRRDNVKRWQRLLAEVVDGGRRGSGKKR
jgi:hypothetical protein